MERSPACATAIDIEGSSCGIAWLETRQLTGAAGLEKLYEGQPMLRLLRLEEQDKRGIDGNPIPGFQTAATR